MGKLIAVNYTIPVACFVDLDADSVVGVAVLDEELQLEGSLFDERGEPVASDSPEASRALSIAEDEGNIWPRWSFGIEGAVQGPAGRSGGTCQESEIELGTPSDRRFDAPPLTGAAQDERLSGGDHLSREAVKQTGMPAHSTVATGP